jgi:zinc D-Ala-D-Ala carboxypeptidase
MQLTPNFSLRELTFSQTAVRRGIDNMPDELTITRLRRVCENVLEPVRAHYGRPVRVTSGYRSPALNAAIGGSTTSQHSLGEAVDFEVPGVSNLDVCRFIAAGKLPNGFDQLILEAYTPGDPNSGWIHCSWSSRRARLHILTMRMVGGRANYLQGLQP